MKILVVGCLGFVGSNLCSHFQKQGFDVLGVDNRYKTLGSDLNLKYIEDYKVNFIHCDIRNNTDVESLFEDHGKFDAIFNMAAQVAFKVSVENPRLDFEINALGNFNLLEAVRKFNEKALYIYASTNQVYGLLNHIELIELDKRFDFKDLPSGVSETENLDFLSPYGCSKGSADLYTIDYGRVYEMNTVVTRFGGIYGPRQFSYEDHGWISYITEQVRKGNAFNRFGHGKQVRDVLYIEDILSAMDAIMLKQSELKNGEVFNIGGGPSNSLSVLELLDLLELKTSKKELSVINPMRQADKLVVYLDINKAKSLLGWAPIVGYEEGIEKLIRWQETI